MTGFKNNKKIYCFINDSTSEGFVVVALRGDGELLATETVCSSTMAKSAIVKALPAGQQAVWVKDPHEHEGVLRACRLRSEREEAAKETHAAAQNDLGGLDREALAKLKGDHICDRCSLAPVCEVGNVIRRSEAEGGKMFVISACYDYTPREKEEE